MIVALCDADKGNHTSGLFLIAAKGMEVSCIALRAAADSLYVRGLDAGGDQLTPVCFGQIDPPGFLQTKLARDVAIHLIATDSDPRSDGRADIPSSSPELCL